MVIDHLFVGIGVRELSKKQQFMKDLRLDVGQQGASSYSSQEINQDKQRLGRGTQRKGINESKADQNKARDIMLKQESTAIVKEDVPRVENHNIKRKQAAQAL